ncbi:MAG: hypothetical protein MJ210_05565, partial [Alphaproteobacteria bacterium]|nr:hypothetical protein [Alphaproteobacteria bacterium]
MSDLKDIRLKAFVKDKMKEALLACGRKMVAEDGIEALSARKLALKANSSVGMIYNLFGTMDNYITEQNVMTLTLLYQQMSKVVLSKDPFNNLNRYADVLTSYIVANPNLWYLLYNRHLAANATKSTLSEARIIKKIDVLIGYQAAKLIGTMKAKEKRLSIKILEMSLFAVSGYLIGNKLNPKSGVNKKTLCKFLMNTYMAGLS